MNGVEILASKEVAIEYAYCWSAFWIVLVSVFTIYVVVGIALSVKKL